MAALIRGTALAVIVGACVTGHAEGAGSNAAPGARATQRGLRPNARRPPTASAFRAVDRAMQRGLQRNVFESAVLLVSRHGQPLFHRAYGNAHRDSVFDLASLTKPLATTATLMRMIDRGRVTLDTRLSELDPSLATQPAARASLSQLLSHSAGLPARNTLSDQTRGLRGERARRRMVELAASTPLAYPRGSRALYSDLSFILLGHALERAGGAPLDRLARRLVFEPLELQRTGFVRRVPTAERARRARLVATERLPRGRRLRGEVHDAKARRMGGVAGHAGLFSSASDVQRIVDALLSAYHGRPSIFSRDVVHRFFDAQPVPDSSFALGWRRPALDGAMGSPFDPRQAVGHLGFTGTSIWMDVPRELSVVLLTNRVYYGRDAAPIRALRDEVHAELGRSLHLRVDPSLRTGGFAAMEAPP